MRPPFDRALGGAAQIKHWYPAASPSQSNVAHWHAHAPRLDIDVTMRRCRIAAMSACPLRPPLRRRNSSAAMTTTSSRPCTVTCCGPSLRTCRTNSLKRALASCKSQWPGCRLPRAWRRGFGCFVSFDFAVLVILTRLALLPETFQALRFDARQSVTKGWLPHHARLVLSAFLLRLAQPHTRTSAAVLR
jgi:hypothetical protein